MAKGLLQFFGGASVLLGFVSLAWGLANNANWIAVSWGAGMLLAGAPLLGFAKVIELLHVIARNTRPAGVILAHEDDGRPVDPAVTEFIRRRDAR